jgi:hypothetical protein
VFSPDTKPTTGLKAPQGQGCPRCGFAVYAAEQMISKHRVSVGFPIDLLFSSQNISGHPSAFVLDLFGILYALV